MSISWEDGSETGDLDAYATVRNSFSKSHLNLSANYDRALYSNQIREGKHPEEDRYYIRMYSPETTFPVRLSLGDSEMEALFRTWLRLRTTYEEIENE